VGSLNYHLYIVFKIPTSERIDKVYTVYKQCPEIRSKLIFSVGLIGLSTGRVEGDASPPEFDMGGHMVKCPPPRILKNATKKKIIKK